MTPRSSMTALVFWRRAARAILGANAAHLKNGRSREQPTVIASYGESGPRPLLKLGDHRAGLSVALNRPNKACNMAILGIHFYDHKGDPHSKDFVKDRDKRGAGIDWKAPGEGLLIEDCHETFALSVDLSQSSPDRRIKKGTSQVL